VESRVRAPRYKGEIFIGQVFGRLTVIDVARRNRQTLQPVVWVCRCSCGDEDRSPLDVTSKALRQGRVKSCGCLHRHKPIMGKRFGRLVVVDVVGERDRPKGAPRIYRCKCDCGNFVDVTRGSLRNGCKSCGCLRRENWANSKKRLSALSAASFDDAARKRRSALLGQTFGKLTVLRFAGKRRHELLWECQCACGNLHEVSTFHLKSGRIKSCGCMQLGHRNFIGQARWPFTRN